MRDGRVKEKCSKRKMQKKNIDSHLGTFLKSKEDTLQKTNKKIHKDSQYL